MMVSYIWTDSAIVLVNDGIIHFWGNPSTVVLGTKPEDYNSKHLLALFTGPKLPREQLYVHSLPKVNLPGLHAVTNYKNQQPLSSVIKHLIGSRTCTLTSDLGLGDLLVL